MKRLIGFGIGVLASLVLAFATVVSPVAAESGDLGTFMWRDNDFYIYTKSGQHVQATFTVEGVRVGTPAADIFTATLNGPNGYADTKTLSPSDSVGTP